MARLVGHAGIVLATLVANLLWVVPVPLGLDFMGGSEIRLRSEPTGVDAARLACQRLEEAYLAAEHGAEPTCHATQRPDRTEFRVTVTPRVEGGAARVVAALRVDARVEFLPVVDGSPWTDQRAPPNRAALGASIDALGAPPDGTRVVFETRADGGGASLLVRTNAVFEPTHVNTARVVRDERDTRPSVQIDLDREGGRLLAAFTQTHSGERLAVVLGDRVVMAPKIHGAIPGGRIRIALGAGSDAAKEREAHELVGVLLLGRVPPLQIEASHDVAPALPSGWGLPLARALGLVGALLAALFLWRRSPATLALATSGLGAALTAVGATVLAGAVLTFAADLAMLFTALLPPLLAGLVLARKGGPPDRLGARLLRALPAIALPLLMALGAALAIALGAHALWHGVAVFILVGAPLVALVVLAGAALVRPAAPIAAPPPHAGSPATALTGQAEPSRTGLAPTDRIG